MQTALLVIDMLNEYLTIDGKVYCAECRSIIPNVLRVKNYCSSKGIPTFFVNTALSKNSVLAEKWGEHAIAGTASAQVIAELSPDSGDYIVEKEGYDGFFRTNLEEQLASLNIKRVIITGIHTHVCVLITAVGAFQRGFDVVTLSDCMTTGYKPNHDTRLRFFVSHIGELKTSDEWISSENS